MGVVDEVSDPAAIVGEVGCEQRGHCQLRHQRPKGGASSR